MPMGAPSPVAGEQPQVVTIDAVMALLKRGVLRHFRIDIEADSTIVGDESQERQDRQALIVALTEFVQGWGPIVAASPIMAPLAGELMRFGVRGFRVGRSLEEVIEETVDKLEQQAGQPKPPPQPSPDELIKLEGTKAKATAEIQKAQIDGRQAQTDAMAKQQQTELDAQAAQRDHVQSMQEADAKQRGQEFQAAVEEQKSMREAQMAELEHARRMELADAQHRRSMEAAKKPKGET